MCADKLSRLVLYFPVSAHVTLFGNILQNPLDPRAKSDTKLMNLVVTFLSMLGQEAEQGGVHRMLGICSEFERIAKKVIEKAEKDQSSRRKRKNQDSSNKSSTTPTAAPNTNSTTPAAVQTPRPTTAASANLTTPGSRDSRRNSNAGQLSPPQYPDRGTSYSPMNPSINEPSPSMPSAGWTQNFQFPPHQQQQQQQPPPQNGDFDSFNYQQQQNMQSPPMSRQMPFQQPLLPQDLFSLPMTLDWSWAEMSGGAYPTVENGNFGEQYPPQL